MGGHRTAAGWLHRSQRIRMDRGPDTPSAIPVPRKAPILMLDPRIVGQRADGRPIFLIAGGAENNFSQWIPEEFSSDVIQRVNQMSAVETYAQKVPMGTETRSTPRSGGVNVGLVSKGGVYTEDQNVNDQVILTVQKFGQSIRIAEEDIDDSLADIVAAKQKDWATSYAKMIDNACLGVSVAKATSGCLFDSTYYQLSQNDASTGYVGGTNITQTATGAPQVSFANLSAAAGIYEAGDYFDEGGTLVIAHPSYKAILRGVVDTQGRPIFQESTGGFPGGGMAPTPDKVFGYDIKWSLGCRTSTTATQTPTGNPLMVFCNPLYMYLGVRSGPESIFIDGRNGLAALTDESILKMRAHRGYNIGHENAFSILERRA